CRRAVVLNLDFVCLPKNAYQKVDKSTVVLLLWWWTHDFQLSSIVNDTQVGPVLQVLKQLLVFIPTALLNYQSCTFWQVLDGIQVICGASTHVCIITCTTFAETSAQSSGVTPVIRTLLTPVVESIFLYCKANSSAGSRFPVLESQL